MSSQILLKPNFLTIFKIFELKKSEVVLLSERVLDFMFLEINLNVFTHKMSSRILQVLSLN